VSIVTAIFNIFMEQMTKLSQQKSRAVQ